MSQFLRGVLKAHQAGIDTLPSDLVFATSKGTLLARRTFITGSSRPDAIGSSSQEFVGTRSVAHATLLAEVGSIKTAQSLLGHSTSGPR
jgi:hypothetical protein